MPHVKNYAPGRFSWMEIGTTDSKAARGFYGDLFGWKYAKGDPDSPFPYWLIQRKKKDLGGCYELMQEMLNQGVRPHWMSYVSVENADMAAERIKALGGNILMAPMDVMDHGRMAVAMDPTGAVFSVWQAKSHIGSRISGEPGTACWHELRTHDVDRAGAFYTSLFGWTGATQSLGGPSPYTMFMAGETHIGGMQVMDAGAGPVPPHWMIYFSVKDCDKSAAKGKKLGGNVMVPPTDIPGIGRFAQIADPQGALFSVIALAE